MSVMEYYMELFVEVLLPEELREWAGWLVAGLLIVAAVLMLLSLWSLCSPGDYGSGNNPWFRHIDTTPRCHQKKHFRLEHVWEYTGRGVVSGATKIDADTKFPLSGPLVGRQTWKAVRRVTDGDRDAMLEPEDGSFDPVQNPVSP